MRLSEPSAQTGCTKRCSISTSTSSQVWIHSRDSAPSPRRPIRSAADHGQMSANLPPDRGGTPKSSARELRTRHFEASPQDTSARARAGLDANPHQPSDRMARHEAVHENQHPVEPPDDGDDTFIIQRTQRRYHNLLGSQARQLSEEPLVMGKHFQFGPGRAG